MAYYQQALTAEEVAARDPFGGRGTRIEVTPGQPREDVIRMVEADHPGRGWVIFDSCAWIEAEDQTIS